MKKTRPTLKASTMYTRRTATEQEDLLAIVGPSKLPSYEQIVHTKEETIQVFLKIAISPALCHSRELAVALGNLLNDAGVVKWRRRILVATILLTQPAVTHTGRNRVLLTYRNSMRWRYSEKVKRMLEPIVLSSQQWLLQEDNTKKLFWFSGHFMVGATTESDSNALAALMDARGQAVCLLLSISLVSGSNCGIDPYKGAEETTSYEENLDAEDAKSEGEESQINDDQVSQDSTLERHTTSIKTDLDKQAEKYLPEHNY